jgi:2-polyprenyl-3-methyl-5-hydroxy-6-metoxy-1,4-benzoquinol methylase
MRHKFIEGVDSTMLKLEEIAENYHLNADIPDMFIENICQKFEFDWAKSEIADSDKVLDLGYGDGLFLNFLKNHENLTIVEGSKKLCEKATKQAIKLKSNAEVVFSFFEDFETEKKFDVVIASHVLEHVQDPVILLQKVKKWLSPNGKLIVIVPNAESFHRKLGVILKLQNKLDDLSPRDHAVGHLRVFNLDSLRDLLHKSGFQVMNERGFFLKVVSNAQMLNLNAEVIHGLCELSTDLPAQFGANIGIVAVNHG